MIFWNGPAVKKCRSINKTLVVFTKRKLLPALICISLFGIIFVSLLPILTKTLLFEMPGPSDAFDCDDGVLLMYERLSSIGIKSVPIVGDLDTTGEKYQEIKHVWLLAEIAGINIAFDWGTPWLDRQHYEGYPITYDQLVQFVKQDDKAIFIE